jgi:NitT/TauT family transport system substrate-binding protein
MKRLSILAGLAAATAAPALAQSPAPQSITVAALPLDPGGEVYYGLDLGWFARAGLDVQLLSLPNGAAIVAGVAGGSINIGYANTLSLISAFRKGLPVTLIAPASINDDRNPTNYLVVASKSTIRSAKDLEGKVIAAAPLKSLADVPIAAWMDANGADSTKAKFVEIPFPEIPAAFAQSRIDAAFMIEPFATQAKSDTRVLTHPYSMIAKRFLGAAYFTTPQWAKDHQDTVARFARVIADTAVWANRNQALSAPILAKYAKVPLTTIQAMTRQGFTERLLATEIQPIIDFAAKYKLIDVSFPAQDMIFKPG